MIHRKKEHSLKNFHIEKPTIDCKDDHLRYIFKQLTLLERRILKRFIVVPFFQVYTNFGIVKDDFDNGKYASISILDSQEIKTSDLLMRFINREVIGKMRITIHDSGRMVLYIRDSYYKDVINLIKNI